jgi:hypothetical protein
MVSSLFAGSPTSSLMRKGWLPESLTRRVVVRPFAPFRGVAGITSEWWPPSVGTVAGIKSESRPASNRNYLVVPDRIFDLDPRAKPWFADGIKAAS